MNMKKLMAGVAASALAVSAMAVSAFADVTAVTFVDQTGKAELGDSSKGPDTRIVWNLADIIPEGVTPEEVYGVTLNLDIDYDESQGMGGSFIFSAKGDRNWKGINWSNEELVDFDKGTLTRLESEPFFNSTDISGADGEYAQVVIDAYWGSGALTVKSIDFLAADGSVITAGAAPAEPTEPAPGEGENPPAPGEGENPPAPGNTNTSTDPNKDKPAVDTGIEGVAIVAGLAIIAAGAVVVAKKRG